MKLMQKTMLASLLLAGMLSSANAASVTYDYVGNDFVNFTTYDPLTNVISNATTVPSHIGPRITGSAAFANGIDNLVTSYMLTDGKNTLDNTMGINPSFFMTFNNNNVDKWAIALASFDTTVYIGLSTAGDAFLSLAGTDISVYNDTINALTLASDFGSIVGSSGTWTLRNEQVSEVPVPAALPLMASALGLFGFAKRRKQSV